MTTPNKRRMPMVGTRVPEPAHAALKALAKLRRVQLSVIVRHAILVYLKPYEVPRVNKPCHTDDATPTLNEDQPVARYLNA